MVRENGMETTTFPQNVIIVASLAAIGFSIWSRFNESATHFQKVWEMPSLILSSFLVTNRNASRASFGRGGNYSHDLLKKLVVHEEYWQHIKGCYFAYGFCQRTHKGFYSHIQSNCCKLPSNCGFEFHNATYWTIPKAGPMIADGDCKIWSNAQNDLCFNCQSCRTTFLVPSSL
ncbi:hypothetical protein P3S68_006469 [Capsicum galapagoense]